jgi:hypothetical protein
MNANKPKLRATIESFVAPLVDLQILLRDMPGYFDVDTAVGAQLDIVGLWVNLTRNIPIPIPTLWFSFDDPDRGFDRGLWFQPFDTQYGISQLDDDTFRRLIYAKIKLDGWGGSFEEAQSILDEFFSADVGTFTFIEDRSSMQMTINMSGKIPSLLHVALLGMGLISPKPMGVSLTYNVTSVHDSPLFGFDVDNDYIKGWDEGSWGVTPEYIVTNNIGP